MHFQISSLSLKIEYNHIVNKLSSVAGDLWWNPIGSSLCDLPPMFESFQPEWKFGERSQIACGEDKIRYDWNNLGWSLTNVWANFNDSQNEKLRPDGSLNIDGNRLIWNMGNRIRFCWCIDRTLRVPDVHQTRCTSKWRSGVISENPLNPDHVTWSADLLPCSW